MGRPKKDLPNHGQYYEVKPIVDYGLDGKPIRKSFYSTVSKADAQEKGKQYADQLQADRMLGSAKLAKNKNVAAWCDVFLAQYVKGTVKGNTYWNNYAAPIENHIKPYFGKVDLSDVKPLDIKLFFKQKRTEGLALGTLEKLRVCLNSLFDAAMENELCNKNPVTKSTKVVSDKPPAVKRTYPREQRDAIIKFARKHKDGLGIILMLENGLSRSELLGLTWEMVDFDNSAINVTQGLVALKDVDTEKRTLVASDPKNTYRVRFIPLEPETAKQLKAAYRGRARVVGVNRAKKKNGTIVLPQFVICNAKGRAMDPDNWSQRTYRDFMRDMVAALSPKFPGIPKLTAHELRHTFATLAQEDTHDLLALMRALGHADLKMLQSTYAHISLEQIRKALNRTENETG